MVQKYRAQALSRASLERAVADMRSRTPRNRSACASSDARYVAVARDSGRSSSSMSPDRLDDEATQAASNFENSSSAWLSNHAFNGDDTQFNEFQKRRPRM